MAPTIRYPAVAGRFYPRDRDDLRADVESFFPAQQETVAAIGCVAPHAGYLYSGHVAGAVYAGLDLAPRSGRKDALQVGEISGGLRGRLGRGYGRRDGRGR